jgi:hypothetical protein
MKMKDVRKKIILLITALSLIGCAQQVEDANKLLGSADMGPIENGTVSAYALNSDGSRGLKIAETATNSNGDFEFNKDNVNLSGPVELVVTGGSYEDEATGAVVSLGAGDEIRLFLKDGASSTSIAISALTTIAAARASENAAGGLETAIENANTDVAAFFGIPNVDFSTAPSFNPANASLFFNALENQTIHGVISAAFTQVVKDQGLQPGEALKLLKNISADFSDGMIDGLDNGAGLPLAMALTPEQALLGMQTASQNFLASPRNKSGLAYADFSFAFPQTATDFP